MTPQSQLAVVTHSREEQSTRDKRIIYPILAGTMIGGIAKQGTTYTFEEIQARTNSYSEKMPDWTYQLPIGLALLSGLACVLIQNRFSKRR